MAGLYASRVQALEDQISKNSSNRLPNVCKSDTGTAPLRYLVILDISDDEKAHLPIGDIIAFEGRLQGFHLVKGMNFVGNNARTW
jgi:hypothetical protein